MATTVIDELITVLTFRGDAEGIQNTRSQLRSMAGDIETAARGLGILGGAITATAGLAFKTAVEWESAWTDVLKTVNGTDQQLEHLEGRLRQMAREEIPLNVEDLAAIAASAGQLGIATENVDEFTDTIAKLGATTNLASEQGAQDLARFANITQMSQQDFDRLGSTIVDLGNNFATTESEIVSMALRLAGAGELIGLTEADILGISTALTSVGINAEAGGTAFSRIMTEMQIAAERGGAELHTFNELVGGDFQRLFESSPDQAILRFVSGLQRMIDDGEDVHRVLETLGFDSVRIRDALLRSAGAGDLMTDSLVRGNLAWKENTALTREAQLRFETTASQLRFLKNNVIDLGITFGSSLAGPLTTVNDLLIPLINRAREFFDAYPEWARVIGFVGVALLGVSGGLFGVAAAMRAYAFLLPAIIKLTAAWNFILALNPLVLVAGLVALLVIGLGSLAYALRDQLPLWDMLRSDARGVWEAIQNLVIPIWTALVAVWRESLRPALEELAEALGLVSVRSRDAGDSAGEIKAGWIDLIGFLTNAATTIGGTIGFLVTLIGSTLAGAISVVARLIEGDWVGALKAAAEWLLRVERAARRLIDVIPQFKTIKGLNQDIQNYLGLPDWLMPGGALDLGDRAGRLLTGGGDLDNRIDNLAGYSGESAPRGRWSDFLKSVIMFDLPLPGFAEGGLVGGPAGQPTPAVVHGGEGILSLAAMREMRMLAEGLVSTAQRMALGPYALAPALPPPAPVLQSAGAQITVEVGGITVYTNEGADAEEIGSTLARHLRDQIEDMVSDFDGPIAR